MILTTAVPSNNAPQGYGSRTLLRRWHENREDSSLHQHIASEAKLPNSHQYSVPNYHEMARSAVMTSQFSNGRTGVTSMGSLPGLSHSCTSRHAESIATSIAERDLDQRQRLLTADGSLTAVPGRVGAQALECPFQAIFGCRNEFDINNEDVWIEHSITHFVAEGKKGKVEKAVAPPLTNKCCFCEKEFREDTGQKSWVLKLRHIKEAHLKYGYRMAAARPDFDLAQYLWCKNVMDTAEYRDWAAIQRGDLLLSSTERPPVSHNSSSSRGGRNNRR